MYVGNCQYKDKILDLLALMGVTIITEDRISTDYEEKEETKELKDILFGKLSPLALIAAGEQTDEVTYRTKKIQYKNCFTIHISIIAVTSDLRMVKTMILLSKQHLAIKMNSIIQGIYVLLT